MVVMTLENVPISLKGELSRWMIEVSTGVYVGKLSALVRNLLWEKCSQNKKTGRCAQVYRTNNEQGFSIRIAGDSKRSVINFDGLELIAIKNAHWEDMFVVPANNDNLERDIKTPKR